MRGLGEEMLGDPDLGLTEGSPLLSLCFATICELMGRLTAFTGSNLTNLASGKLMQKSVKAVTQTQEPSVATPEQLLLGVLLSIWHLPMTPH